MTPLAFAELVRFDVPGETLRVTTSGPSVEFEGELFTRSALAVAMTKDSVRFSLPLEHPFSQRGLAGGIRPRQFRVNLWRFGEQGKVELKWEGELIEIECTELNLELIAASPWVRMLRQPLPGAVVSRQCQHRLFSQTCGALRSEHAIRSRICDVDGTKISLSDEFADVWARGGELVHVPSGEVVDIVEVRANEVGRKSILMICSTLYNGKVGDVVEVTPGCDREIETCRDRFHNVVRFGGHPFLPRSS